MPWAPTRNLVTPGKLILNRDLCGEDSRAFPPGWAGLFPTFTAAKLTAQPHKPPHRYAAVPGLGNPALLLPQAAQEDSRRWSPRCIPPSEQALRGLLCPEFAFLRFHRAGSCPRSATGLAAQLVVPTAP